MNKADLVFRLCDATGVAASTVSRVVDELTRQVSESLKAGDTLTIRGFGSFRPVHRTARVLRTPDGSQVFIPARVTPVFKASDQLVKRINDK